MVEAYQGFFPVVSGESVSVTQAGGLVFAAAHDLTLREGGGQLIAAGNNLDLSEGGGMVLAAGNRLSVNDGGAMVAVSPNIEVRRGMVGIALAAHLDIADDSRVVVDVKAAAVIGVVAGVVFALISRVLGR